MDKASAGVLEERVLLLPPTKRDGAAAARLFEAAGILLTTCESMAGLCCELERGAAVAVAPEEAILNDHERCLARFLKEQPSWSDFPLVVLASPRSTLAAERELELIGPMTLVRRPVEIRSLLSTILAGIRDRRRQYARREDFVELERQAAVLRENDRHKDEFLAMLAHELRNPLAAVNNAVSVLKRSADHESRKWASEIVERQVKQLVRLIDDLLDISRITSGKIRLRKEFVDAGVILDQAIESARPLIEERGHTLSVSIERGRLWLHADAARVEQIFVNLLTNAAKYTESEGRIGTIARAEGDWAVISVRDNGTGIPPERLPEMFQLFTQGERTLARSEGGLGIGLTIVQKLTEMHGGSVVARSEGTDRGSEFIVTLPLTRKPVEAGPGARTGDPVAGRASRILVVDDHVDTARGMVQILELLGNDVVVAHDGRTAIETARRFAPDFVLLDIGLPELDGYQVAAALRDDKDLQNAVIIAVSGYGQEEDRRRSLSAGFDHHLVKPVDFETLVSLIARPG